MKTVLNVAKVTDDSGAIILSNQVLTEIRQNVVVKKDRRFCFSSELFQAAAATLIALK